MTASASRAGVTYDFSGRTAIVTGGMRGIGAAIVTALRAANARVIVWDIDAVSGDDEQQVDITDGSAIDHALAKVPRLDILVNAAAIARPHPPHTRYGQGAGWLQRLLLFLLHPLHPQRDGLTSDGRSAGRGAADDGPGGA